MDPVVLAALIAAAAAVIGPVLQGRKTRKATSALASEMATNHGMRPGQYLEEIHAGLTLGRNEVADIRRLMVVAAEHSERLANDLAKHTADDEAAARAIAAELAKQNAEFHRLLTPERTKRARKP